MKVKVNVNGIEQEVDAKNLQIGEVTLDTIFKKVINLEKDISKIDEKYRKRELRLIKTWKSLRGNNNG